MQTLKITRVVSLVTMLIMRINENNNVCPMLRYDDEYRGKQSVLSSHAREIPGRKRILPCPITWQKKLPPGADTDCSGKDNLVVRSNTICILGHRCRHELFSMHKDHYIPVE